MLEMAIPDPQDAVCGLVYVSWCPHAMNLNKNIDRHRGGGLCPFIRKSGEVVPMISNVTPRFCHLRSVSATRSSAMTNFASLPREG